MHVDRNCSSFSFLQLFMNGASFPARNMVSIAQCASWRRGARFKAALRGMISCTFYTSELVLTVTSCVAVLLAPFALNNRPLFVWFLNFDTCVAQDLNLENVCIIISWLEVNEKEGQCLFINWMHYGSNVSH